MPRTMESRTEGISVTTCTEGVQVRAYTYPSSTTSSEASMPLPRAKPCAALVGLPSASKAILAEGPLNTSFFSSVAAGMPLATTIRRRGELKMLTSPWGMAALSRSSGTSLPSCFTALARSNAGISSVPISKASVRCSICYSPFFSSAPSGTMPTTCSRYAAQQALAMVRTRRI